MGACFGKLLVAGEKLSLCCAGTALICCLVATILTVLGLGIGLGYNHCFIDSRTRFKYVPAHYAYPDNPRMPYNPTTMKALRNRDEDLEELTRLLEENNNVDPIRSPGNIFDSVPLNITPISNVTLPPQLNSENVLLMLNSSSINGTEFINNTEVILNNSASKENNQDAIHKQFIPLTGINLVDLISKLKDSNNNYSIQIIKN